MEYSVRETDPMRVVAMRHTGPYPQIGPVFDKLMQTAGPLQIPIRGAIAIFYMDPGKHAAEELQSDACVVVPGDYTLEAEGLTIRNLPAQFCACAHYVGPYQGLPGAWNEFMGTWFPQSGYTAEESGFSYEQYLNNPMDTPAEKLETNLFLPVKRG